MKAIYLKDSLDIVSGAKTAIVLPRQDDSLPGCHALVVKDEDGAKAVGILELAEPTPLHTEQFSQKQSEHGVTEEDKLKWWGNTKEFWLYRVVEFVPCEAEETELLPGTKMHLEIEQDELWSTPIILERVDNICIIGQKKLTIEGEG